MDNKKSQKKLSPYRKMMREGLSFSDYMDDSVPADVKPVYSLKPMQEQDFPIQAKDLFKGLHETPKMSETDGGNLFIGMKPDDMELFKSHLAQLFAYLQKELQLKTVPKVKLMSDEKNADKVLGKTAYYNPGEKLVVLYITNRHQKDILRSFAHEIIHHWQHENEKLNTNQGESDPKYAQNNPWLRQMEKQAYLLGNMLFRDWEDDKKVKDRKSSKKMVENTNIQSIPPETPYGVMDTQTKKIVFRTTYANRNRARRFADNKDLEYGAHRYTPMILRGEIIKESEITYEDRQNPEFVSGFRLAVQDKRNNEYRSLKGYPESFVRGYNIVKREGWWDRTNARLTQFAADLGNSTQFTRKRE